MTRKRPAEIEDEPPTAAQPGDNDVDHLMRLLSWGRANGYMLGPTVKVGDVTVHVQDIRLAKREGALEQPQAQPGIYEEHGLTTTDVPVDGTH